MFARAWQAEFSNVYRPAPKSRSTGDYHPSPRSKRSHKGCVRGTATCDRSGGMCTISYQKGLQMKITARITVSVALLALGLGSALAQDKGNQTKAPPPPGLTLTSSSFKDGDVIPDKYTHAAGP